MKKKLNNLMLLLVAVTICSGIFSSCKEEVLPTATRLFRPILTDNDVVAALDVDTVPYITVTWSKYTTANEYVISAIASDGTDSATITTDTTICTFHNLKFDTEYNIKIHCVNTDNGLKSDDFIKTIITPDFPTMLYGISSSNVIDTQVRISWNTVYNNDSTVYDSLKIYNVTKDSLVRTIAVTKAEMMAGELIVKKLTPNTDYRVEAYNKGKYKGKQLFTTVSPESFQGMVFDLRDLDDDASYTYFSVGSTSLYANTLDSLIQANPDQDLTFVLQGGETYRMPTLMLPATTGKLKFVTGLSLKGEAVFAVAGNFDVTSGVTVGGVELDKIFFTDAPLEGKIRNSSNFGGTYLFNLGQGGGSEIKDISINHCIIKYKRGVLRIKSAATVDSVSINDCVIDSIAGYGITNADNSDAQITNVDFSNSTFSNCEKLYVNAKSTAYTVNQVHVTNCTFVYCDKDKYYMFDYNGCTISDFAIKNCLFGRPGTMTTGALPDGVSGWRGNNSPNCSDLYFTSDFNWVVNTDMTLKNPLTGTTLDTDTPGTFKDPDNGDFTNTSSKLKSLLPGDPRWY